MADSLYEAMEHPDMESMSWNSDSIPVGEGASGRGSITSVEGDVVFYIPERRRSLDLPPMDTSQWGDGVKASSPALSYTSMHSDVPADHLDDMADEDEVLTSVHLVETGSFSSCYSLDSDDCENRTRKVRSKEERVPELPERPESFLGPNPPHLTVQFTFQAISKTLKKISQNDLRNFKVNLWKQYPKLFSAPPKDVDLVDLVDRLLECYDLQGSLMLTRALLQEMELTAAADYLQELCINNEVRCDLRNTLKKKYGTVYEGSATQGKAFDRVFTDLYVTSRVNYGPNIQHEIRNIEKLDSNRQPEIRISHNDIFSSDVIENTRVRVAVTTGMPGTGKTMAVQKFIMDWVEEQPSHKHISFLIPLPFRDLNTLPDCSISLNAIINKFYPEMEKLKDLNVPPEEGYVMIICDGMDEYKRALPFHTTEIWHDSTEPGNLNVIVINLLKGNLLFRAVVWVTNRPITIPKITAESVDKVAEVRGFTEEQKEQYFRKRFEDPVQADRVMSHLHSNKTLHIMCHLPMFCSVLSGMFQEEFDGGGSQAKLPRSLTPIYTRFLMELLRARRCRAPDRSLKEETTFLMDVGKMAYVMLEKGEITISESRWKESGVDITEAVVNSGLCTIFTAEKYFVHHEDIYCFIHYTVQEYMAALYVFLVFSNQGKTALGQSPKNRFSFKAKANSLSTLFAMAIDRTLDRQDGMLDIFLRFLFGMALTSSQEMLGKYITSSKTQPSVIQDTASLIRKKILENQHPERNATLQHCLAELGIDQS